MGNQKTNLNIQRPTLLIENLITSVSRIIELAQIPKWSIQLLIDIIDNLNNLKEELLDNPEFINVNIKHHANEAIKKDPSVDALIIWIPLKENPDMMRITRLTVDTLIKKNRYYGRR